MSVYQAITSRHSTCVLTPILPQHIRKSLTHKAFNNSFRFKVFTLLQAKLHTPRGMTDEVIIKISLAALLRWQPERSEVSLYIICIMAYKVSLYFIDGFKNRSYHGEPFKSAPQKRKVTFWTIQLSKNK